MDQFAPEMGGRLRPRDAGRVGSGSSVKTRYLLDGLPNPVAYVPVDISGDHLQQTSRNWPAIIPESRSCRLCADFTQDFALPRSQRTASHAAVYFPGSTIGNFTPDEAVTLLRRITQKCGTGGGL